MMKAKLQESMEELKRQHCWLVFISILIMHDQSLRNFDFPKHPPFKPCSLVVEVGQDWATWMWVSWCHFHSRRYSLRRRPWCAFDAINLLDDSESIQCFRLSHWQMISIFSYIFIIILIPFFSFNNITQTIDSLFLSFCITKQNNPFSILQSFILRFQKNLSLFSQRNFLKLFVFERSKLYLIDDKLIYFHSNAIL